MKNLILLLFFILSASIAFSQNPNGCFQQKYNAGVQLYYSGNFDKALAQFLEAKKCPDRPADSNMRVWIFKARFADSLSPADNMIPDPGFEIYKKLPEGTGLGNHCLIFWKDGAFDYYSRYAKSYLAQIPNNNFGHQRAHKGSAYIGNCILNEEHYKNYNENVRSVLKDTLKKGQKYCVRIHISMAEQSKDYLNNYGVIFITKDSLVDVSRNGVVFYNPLGYTEKKEWICLSQVYIAKGNEVGLEVGEVLKIPHPKVFSAHYYVDDVSVIRTDSICNCTENKTAIPPELDNMKTGEKLTLDNITFESGSAVLKSESYEEIDILYAFLKKYPKAKLEISGHTDNVGNDNFNIELSRNRAQSVVDYLVQKGIDIKRLKYVGYGSSKPLVPNDTDEGRLQNRRVEMKILSK